MLVSTVVLGVALLVCVAAVIQRSMALAAARSSLAELEQHQTTLVDELGAANGRADSADAKATKATAEALAATKEIESSRQEAESVRAELKGEREHREKSERAAADATVAAADATARAEMAEMELERWPAEGVWALDARRVERVWRHHVSVTLDGRSPLEGAADPASVATQVLADASREETGVVVDVTWRVDPVLQGVDAVLVTRLAEELIAAARSADGADLDVHRGDRDVTLTLRTDPAVVVDESLVEAARACGATVACEHAVVAIRIPVVERSR